jgi:hypothetical protein
VLSELSWYRPVKGFVQLLQTIEANTCVAIQGGDVSCHWCHLLIPDFLWHMDMSNVVYFIVYGKCLIGINKNIYEISTSH